MRVYHRHLSLQIQKNRNVLHLELNDLKAYDEQLYEKFMTNPQEMLKVMEEGVRLYLREKKEEFPTAKEADWQVALRSD